MSEEREKLNALDFLVNVLREHEKTLDALEERLERIVDMFEGLKEDRVKNLGARGHANKLIFNLPDLKVEVTFKDGEIEIKPLYKA